MSTLKTNNVQVGQSVTATNNFTLYQPSTPDGTVRLGVGNSGATTLDVVAVTSAGNVGIGTNSPVQKLEVSGSADFTTNVGNGNGIRIRTPSGSGSAAIIQFTNNPVTAQWGYITSPAAGVLTFGNAFEYVRMDSGGRVTMPYQPYYVGVDRASTYSGSGTVWVHSTTRVNTGSCMNTSTGVFTCPIAGRYLVMFHVLTRANAAHNVAIQKNGTTWVAGRDITPSGEQCTGAWSVVDCAANDQLRIFVDCDVTGDFWSTYNATTMMLIS